MKRAALALVLALPLLLAGCSDDGSPGPNASAAPCTAGLLPSASPETTPPSGTPVIPGMVFHRTAKQGATRLFFAHAEGDGVVEVRDRVEQAFRDAGYTDLTTDAEPPAEAELQFDGASEGSVQVTPLCAGHVQVRYRISG